MLASHREKEKHVLLEVIAIFLQLFNSCRKVMFSKVYLASAITSRICSLHFIVHLSLSKMSEIVIDPPFEPSLPFFFCFGYFYNVIKPLTKATEINKIHIYSFTLTAPLCSSPTSQCFMVSWSRFRKPFVSFGWLIWQTFFSFRLHLLREQK